MKKTLSVIRWEHKKAVAREVMDEVAYLEWRKLIADSDDATNDLADIEDRFSQQLSDAKDRLYEQHAMEEAEAVNSWEYGILPYWPEVEPAKARLLRRHAVETAALQQQHTEDLLELFGILEDIEDFGHFKHFNQFKL